MAEKVNLVAKGCYIFGTGEYIVYRSLGRQYLKSKCTCASHCLRFYIFLYIRTKGSDNEGTPRKKDFK